MSGANVDDLIVWSGCCCQIASFYCEWPSCLGCQQKTVCCCIENQALYCKLPVAGITPPGVSVHVLVFWFTQWYSNWTLIIRFRWFLRYCRNIAFATTLSATSLLRRPAANRLVNAVALIVDARSLVTKKSRVSWISTVLTAASM